MIKVEHLTKYYGEFMAVEDLSFEIEEGHVYGFLGPNGAGKSTTMNIMTGCLSATGGTVRIGGHDIFEEPETAKKLIGYLPEQPPLYMNETPLEYLQFVGEAKGLRGDALWTQIDRAVRQAGIEQVQDRLIGALSKGYRQRVGIAQALLGDPEVIILDEPTVGLDPLQIIEIRDLIRRLGEKHTVILSSHILSEVQAICEKVLIIAHGKLVAYDTPENLETLMARRGNIRLRVEAGAEETGNILRQVQKSLPQMKNYTCEEADTGVTEAVIEMSTERRRSPAQPDEKPEKAGETASPEDGEEEIRETCRTLFFAFAEHKKAILEMTADRANLEEVFLELTEDA